MNKVQTLEVILVNSKDKDLGTMEKLEVHQKGLLHRAFSILVFNAQNELLLQRRAFGKYHSEGLWTNTCCSHPNPGESNLDAAHRRLMEEMGFDCALTEAFHFIYKVELENDLIEHELDHVIIGYYDKDPSINLEEVSEYQWLDLEVIQKDLIEHPEKYTYWFKLIMTDHLKSLKKSIGS